MGNIYSLKSAVVSNHILILSGNFMHFYNNNNNNNNKITNEDITKWRF